MLSLYIDRAAWQDHLGEVAASMPGLVPVVKGNGYGFGLEALVPVAEGLTGAPRLIIAVGTYDEAQRALAACADDATSVMVLTPWRNFDERVFYDDRLIHTLGRLADVDALSSLPESSGRRTKASQPPRVVLEVMTSMLRHGFNARDLRRAATHLDNLHVEGFALHLPMSGGSPVAETTRLINDMVASGAATRPTARRIFVSHIASDELATLRSKYPDFEFRPRVGTMLWLGRRQALEVRAQVLDVHPVERGDAFGYRGRTAPKQGHILVVSGGTAHGVGLEAPTSGATMRDRAARVAKGGLDAAGFVRSPFTVGGKQRLFAEPPHMQVSMLFLPAGAPVPEVGAELEVQVRFTTTSFDRVVER